MHWQKIPGVSRGHLIQQNVSLTKDEAPWKVNVCTGRHFTSLIFPLYPYPLGVTRKKINNTFLPVLYMEGRRGGVPK